MLTFLKKLFTREEGQGMAEYGLILVFVAVFCVAAFTLLGTNLDTVIRGVAGHL